MNRAQPPRSRLSILALCSLGTLAGVMFGCDGSGVADPAIPSVNDLQMQVVAGSNQVGVPGERLPDPLIVRVVNQFGKAQKGQIVNFVVAAGGGSVFAGSSVTDAKGMAQEIWTLGSGGGDQRVEARAVDTQTGEGRIFAIFEATTGEAALSLELSADSIEFTALEDTLRLKATGGSGTGGIQWAGYTWSSRNPSVASVDNAGLVEARAPGQTWVVASDGSGADSARVVVRQLPAQIIVGAPAGSLESARSMQLAASVLDASGHEVEGSHVVWTSSDAQRAGVSDAGLVRGIAPGAVTIVAAAGGVSGTSTISVFDPPLPGTLFFSDDMESGSLAAWHDGVDVSKHSIVTDPTAARSGSRGLRVDYPAGGDGGWLTQFFTSGYDAIHVRYWVQLAPGWQGGTALVGAYGSRTDDRWSAFGKFGTCPNGSDFFNTFLQAVGGNPGSVGFLTSHPGMGGTCQGSSGDAGTTYMDNRNLTPGQWHRIEMEIKANTPGLADGEQRMWIDGELKGTWNGIRFRDSYVLMLNAVQLAFGSATGAPQSQHLFLDDIQISYLDVQGGADAVSSVVIAPTTVSVVEGGTAQLEADVRNAQGTSLAGYEVRWTSSNPGVAAVDGTGRVSAVVPGSATITATSGGVAGTASVTVTAAPVGSASVELSVTSIRLTSLGASRTVGVTAINEHGATLSAGDLSWSSTAPGVATVNGNGLVTAASNGETRIIAAFGSAADTATVTVSQEVSSLTVTPSSASLEVGGSLGLAAEARDALGAVVQGASMSWASSNAGVASVDGSGRVTAVTAGLTTVGVTTSGQTAASTIEVTQAAGTGNGRSGWPNEPSGFVPITDQPWDALSSHGWGHMNREASSRIVADASAPHSPSSVLEHLYPAGFTNHGAEPAVDWKDLGGPSEIFVGFWWKPSNPWQGHSTGINKVLFAWDQYNSRNVVLTMRGSPGGPYHLEAFPEGHPAQSAGYLSQNMSRIPVRLGEWHRVELRVSIPNGIIQWWVDGTLVGDYRGLDLSSGGFGELQIAPTWGGIGGADKQQTDYFRYDHVFVSKPGG